MLLQRTRKCWTCSELGKTQHYTTHACGQQGSSCRSVLLLEKFDGLIIHPSARGGHISNHAA